MPNGMPPGPPAAPPPGPPPGAPPPGPMGPGPAGPGGPGDMNAAMDQQAAAQQAAIGAGAPQPKKPYSVKAIQAVDKQFIDTVESLAGDVEIPEEAEWQPPEGMGPKWEQPLPVEVFGRLAMFSQLVKDLGQFEKYVYEPTELVDDTALRAAQAKLKMAGKDKKLAQALQAPTATAGGPGAPPPGEGPPPPEAGPPGAPSEEEKTIMGAA